MIEDMVGKWQMVSSDNWDAHMKELGISWALRQMLVLAKPYLTIAVNGDQFTMTSESSISTSVVEFKLDQEFDENTMDGRAVKSTFKLENGQLIQIQLGKVDCTITRYLENGELVAVGTANGVQVIHRYKKVA